MFLIPTFLRPSPIHGIGVFTQVSIAKGTKIWEFTPRFDHIYTESDLAILTDVQRATILFYGYSDPRWGADKIVMCGDNARHFNFSANPNTAERDFTEPPASYAIRDIAAGEELTYSEDEDLDAARKLGF
jgi:SET domain-containing protein